MPTGETRNAGERLAPLAIARLPLGRSVDAGRPAARALSGQGRP
jgi:hypothetical protein